MSKDSGGNKRKTAAEARRAQVLEIALALFAEVGFERATMKMLATRADISPGLIYHYFRDKEELIEAVMESHSLIPEMREIYRKAEPLPIEEALQQICWDTFHLYWKNKETIWLFFREMRTNPQIGASMARSRDQNFELFNTFLQRRVERGELIAHNTCLTTHLLLSSVFLIHLDPKETPSCAEDLRGCLAEQIGIVLYGLKPR